MFVYLFVYFTVLMLALLIETDSTHIYLKNKIQLDATYYFIMLTSLVI